MRDGLIRKRKERKTKGLGEAVKRAIKAEGKEG